MDQSNSKPPTSLLNMLQWPIRMTAISTVTFAPVIFRHVFGERTLVPPPHHGPVARWKYFFLHRRTLLRFLFFHGPLILNRIALSFYGADSTWWFPYFPEVRWWPTSFLGAYALNVPIIWYWAAISTGGMLPGTEFMYWPNLGGWAWLAFDVLIWVPGWQSETR